jgi:Tfp pilus assembly protein PilP
MASVRVLLIVGLMGALIAWVVAPAVPVSGGGPPSAESSAGRDTTRTHTSDAHSRLNVELRRLHTSLASMPSPSTPRRDPFRFAGGAHGRSDTESEPATATAATTGGETPQDRPQMQLLGIAEDGDPAAVERTAVIATPRQVYMVKEGDQIAFRFQVARIGADAVELRDLAQDATFTLTLR